MHVNGLDGFLRGEAASVGRKGYADTPQGIAVLVTDGGNERRRGVVRQIFRDRIRIEDQGMGLGLLGVWIFGIPGVARVTAATPRRTEGRGRFVAVPYLDPLVDHLGAAPHFDAGVGGQGGEYHQGYVMNDRHLDRQPLEAGVVLLLLTLKIGKTCHTDRQHAGLGAVPEVRCFITPWINRGITAFTAV